MLPENILDAIPSYIIPLFYSGIAQWIFWSFQKKKIDELKNNGHTHNSTWKVLWIVVLWLLITLIPALGIWYLASPQVVTRSYWIWYQQNTIESINLTTEESDRINKEFEEAGFFDKYSKNPKSIFIVRDWDMYEFHLAIMDELYTSTDDSWLQELKKFFQSILPNKKVTLIVHNEKDIDIHHEIK